MQPSVLRIAIAEAVFAGLLALVFAAQWAGLGPDSTGTGVVTLSALFVSIGLVAGLPWFLFAAIRDFAKSGAHRSVPQVSIVIVGITLWFVLAGWLASLYFAGVLSHT